MFPEGSRKEFAGQPWKPANSVEMDFFTAGPCRECTLNADSFKNCDAMRVLFTTKGTKFYYDDEGQPQCSDREV